MLTKAVSGIMLTLLLIGMLTLAFNIQPVKAEPRTWTVDDDGPADFHAIQEAINAASDGDTVFVYNGTYYENVVVNKAVSLVGESKYGTFLDGSGTGTVVYVTSDDVNISDFTIQNSGWTYYESCIFVDGSSSNNISHNIITTDGRGICLNFSGNNILANNNISLTDTGMGGIFLLNSSNNILSGNIVSKGYCGIHLSCSNSNIVSDNHVYFTEDEGITLWDSGNNTLTNNSITNIDLWSFGVYGLSFSAYNNYIDTSNTVDGKPIYYLIGVANAVFDAPINATTVYLINCKNITIQDLTLTGNIFGVCFWNTTNSKIQNVTVSVNAWGIFLGSSGNNILANNSIFFNDGGIFLWGSSDNVIFHNNFIRNELIQQVRNDNSINTWDDGYPSGGNYWSDYTGIDIKKGADQNITGSDGIGDTTYQIDANNIDKYPLMGQFNTFDAGTWNGTAYNVDVVSNSTVSDFHFNPNEGAFLRFNVTGDDGASGFCRVTIPKSLLWVEDGWTITVGDQPITDYTLIPDENYTYLYFTYNHSTQTVTIQGTHVIPEFPLTMILPLFMLTTLIAAILLKKKRKTNPQPLS
jgi:parallel beta-helix repeat protein